MISIWALITFSFLIIHLVPGNPVRKALGINASADLVAQTQAKLGLGDNLAVQYWHYLANLVRGDWGSSIVNGSPVRDTVAQLLPNTLLLAIPAFVLVMLVAIPLGLAMAVLTQNGRRRGTELAFTSASILAGAIPEFLLAVLLVYVFGVSTHLLPIAGKNGLSSFVLPVLALALGAIMAMSRIVRVEVLSVLGADFIRTARIKRIRSWRVYLRHALPNALTATMTLSGLLLGGLISGTVLIETIFAWPGLGRQLVSAITGLDFPMVQALVLVYGGLVLVINFVVDALLAVIDPRSALKDS